MVWYIYDKVYISNSSIAGVGKVDSLVTGYHNAFSTGRPGTH